MKKIFFAAIAVLAALTACNDNTDTLGSTLTDEDDILSIYVDTFEVTTQSVKVDSVYNRSIYGYLGRCVDPETGIFYASDFITQFGLLPEYDLTADSVKLNPIDADGNLCSNCDMRLYIDSYYGDSLASMKARIMELSKPMEESVKYFSNFDPEKEGMIRANGFQRDQVYALYDRSVSDSIRALDGWMNRIVISLNKTYTDKSGNKYNNIGSYILRNYFDHREYFKDSYSFIHNVLPGFYIKNVSGLGSMASICRTEINMVCNVTKKVNGKDSTMYLVTSIKGTDEEIQSSHITDNDEAIEQLAKTETCTYIKTPASIFTEVTVPVLDIFEGHETDSLNSAKVAFKCINADGNIKNKFPFPQTLLILQSDSAYSFFINARNSDYTSSFTADYSSTTNAYTFNNISTLIQKMYRAYINGVASDSQWALKHPDWNKLMLVPVKTNYTAYGTTTTLSDITNDLSLSSTRLVGGPKNNHDKILMSVVYTKFEN